MSAAASWLVRKCAWASSPARVCLTSAGQRTRDGLAGILHFCRYVAVSVGDMESDRWCPIGTWSLFGTSASCVSTGLKVHLEGNLGIQPRIGSEAFDVSFFNGA